MEDALLPPALPKRHFALREKYQISILPGHGAPLTAEIIDLCANYLQN
jgi:hypothetical protein